jgi:hypothetical protein
MRNLSPARIGQRAHDETPIFHGGSAISSWDGPRVVRLKLWDEDRARLITWADRRLWVPETRSRF